MNLPKVVSRDEWNAAHKKFLVKEKKATRAKDALNAERRELPMVEVDKKYTFEGPKGDVQLADLFDGRRQLITYHFMFEPDWDEGCPSCSFVADNLPHFYHLHRRDTSLVVVSRAPLSKLQAYQKRMGWDFPWYSSEGSDFNYDFHATLDDSKAEPYYNHNDRKQLEEMGIPEFSGMDVPGASVFLRDGKKIFHTYSTHARGTEIFDSTYHLLDLTALGRQEDWEKPKNRYTGEVKDILRHDEYESK